MTLAQKIEDNAGQKAIRGFAKILAVIIILAVAAFGDVMYVIEIQNMFKNQGFLLIFCYIGAIAGFLSVCYILMGKASVFQPGGQMLASWIVFGMELVIIALNIMYVFKPDKDGPLAAWGYVSPITPVLHMLGIALVYMLDPELKARHRKKELQQKIDAKNDEFEYYKTLAQLDVQTAALGHLKKRLNEKANSETTVNAVDDFAEEVTSQLLAEMTGRSLPPPKDRNGRDRGFGHR